MDWPWTGPGLALDWPWTGHDPNTDPAQITRSFEPDGHPVGATLGVDHGQFVESGDRCW
jgi:hypothetical protein